MLKSLTLLLALMGGPLAAAQAPADSSVRPVFSGSLSAGIGTHGRALRFSFEKGDRLAMVLGRLAITTGRHGAGGLFEWRSEWTTGIRYRLLRVGPVDLAAGISAGLGASVADDGTSRYLPPLAIDVLVPVEADASFRLSRTARIGLTTYRSFPTGLAKDDRTDPRIPSLGQWGTVLGLRLTRN